MLFVGYGGGHIHSVFASGMLSKATAAGSDFDDSFAGFELKLSSNTIIFGL
jgi:hypothetical protein